MRKHMDVQEIVKLSQAMFMDEDEQTIQQALALLKEPDFLLRCKVESDTLSDIDFQAEKQDRMEYMMTITNYLKEILPTMQQDPTMGPFLMRLLQFSLAGFKIGKKYEGELDRTFRALEQQLANPQPPQPTPEEQKAQAEIALMEKEGEMRAKENQQNLQFKAAEGQQKLQLQRQAGQIKLVEMRQNSAMKQQVTAADNRMKMQTAGIQDQIERQKMWRRQQESALDAAQNAQAGGAFDRKGKNA
jgi:hypothetical protein